MGSMRQVFEAARNDTDRYYERQLKALRAAIQAAKLDWRPIEVQSDVYDLRSGNTKVGEVYLGQPGDDDPGFLFSLGSAPVLFANVHPQFETPRAKDGIAWMVKNRKGA